MSKIQSALERAKAAKKSPESRSAPATAPNHASMTGQFLAKTPNSIDVARIRNVPVSLETFEASRLLMHDSKKRHPAQGAYRMLRTRLMQNMRSNNWRILGISSIGKSEGKTFTAINLAISIAAEIGQDAVLVDLDLQRPSIYRYLGIDPQSFTGLRDYLSDDTKDLSDLLVRPGIERLGCMLSSVPLERSSDVLASPRGKQLFAELRERIYEKVVIVVDLPPLLSTDDALAVAPMLDALLLVVAEGQAERSDLTEARQMLEEFNLIGTVLNKSSEKDSKRTTYY